MQLNKIKTNRLILTAPVLDDLKSVFEIHSNLATYKFSRLGPHASIHESSNLLKE